MTGRQTDVQRVRQTAWERDGQTDRRTDGQPASQDSRLRIFNLFNVFIFSIFLIVKTLVLLSKTKKINDFRLFWNSKSIGFID